MIIDGFVKSNTAGCELVIIGGTTTPYYKSTLSRLRYDNVRFIGPIYDQDILDEIRGNARVYLHGHSVGGTNPSLLEALATVSGQILCHDNKYNREVAASEAKYFGDEEQLAELMRRYLGEAEHADRPPRTQSRDMRFHPDTIFCPYRDAFRQAFPKTRHRPPRPP